MNFITGATVGALSSLFLLVLTGGLWGGIIRASPCHPAPDFLTGAFWGGLLAVHQYGIPVAWGLGIAGGVASTMANR